MLYCGRCGSVNDLKPDQSGKKKKCTSCEVEFPLNAHTSPTPAFCLFCQGCGESLCFPIQEAGKILSCPKCWMPVQLPEINSPEEIAAKPEARPKEMFNEKRILPEALNGETVSQTGAICAICQTPIVSAEGETQSCPECHTLYHRDCWEENRGCAVYGCSQVPETEHHQSIEIPVSYWGQEYKPCPNCGQQILAAAIRCRHCGTTFTTARPLGSDEFRQRQAQRERFPALRRAITWLFVFCIIPFSAPFAMFFGFLWYRANQKDIAAMPALYDALCKVALGVAIGQTVLAFFVLLFYAGFQPSVRP